MRFLITQNQQFSYLQNVTELSIAGILIPVSLVVCGGVLSAGHAAFHHLHRDARMWRRALRALLYSGLILVLAASDQLVATTCWLGALPSIGLAYHVWFCRQMHV